MTGVTVHRREEQERPGVGTADDRCMLLASTQHGCISFDQALACGLSHEGVTRRARSGRWRRLLPRVYILGGTPETWKQKLAAAVLWGGDGAAVSGLAAAALWDFPDSNPGSIEISLPRGRRRIDGVRVRRVALPRADVTSRDGLAVTTPARTVLDIAGRTGARAFDAAFHHCLHARIVTIESLEDLAERACRPGRPGSRRFRAAVAAYRTGDRPLGSPLEARCARLLARSRLPRPVRQHEVHVGGRVCFLDFAWPPARVALEVDGYRWHSSRTAWENDRARLSDLRRAGWTVVQATYGDVTERFDRVIEELAALLAP